MTTAELKSRTLVAAAAARQNGFMHTYEALINIFDELENVDLTRDHGLKSPKPRQTIVSH